MAAISTTALAQSGTNSPYSAYGLGELTEQSSGFNRGMNGLGLGFREHNQVNYQNPASYSALDSLSFIFDTGLSLQLTNFSENGKKVNAILVDEAQFLSPEEVDALSDIVDFYEIPVLCYGLRTDFLNHLFPGSRRLMEIADVIEEVPTVCWCGKRAQCNTRYSNGKIVREGAQIMLGSNESYVALCRKHYKEGKLWK